MKKLALSIDARNRELSIYEDSTFVNFYETPSGSDIKEIPSGAGYVQITSEDAAVWYKIGNDEITAAVPSGDITDGSSSSFLNAAERITHRIVSETHIALESSGNVVVSYWSQ